MTEVKSRASGGPSGLDRAPLYLVLFKARAFLALILLIVAFSALSPAFLSADNLVIITKHVAITAILAVGMTFVIITGGIDLSVGSIAGLAAMIAGVLLTEGVAVPGVDGVVFFDVWIVILVALVAGAMMGWGNGILVTRFNVAPFIATLGMLYVARGIAMLSSDGRTLSGLGGDPALGNTGFSALGSATPLGVPLSIWIMVAITAAAAFLAKKMPFGRQVYAIGGSEQASRLSGIRVNRNKTLVYVISGTCAALAGLIIASQLQAAAPATGTTYELNAIAAVVLGGTSLSGGRGTIGGTLIGAFVIGVLADGLVLLGVSEFWQTVIKGVVIVLAVAMDQLQRRMQRANALPARHSVA